MEELFSSAPTRPNRQTKSEQTKLNDQEPSASCSRNAASTNRVDSVEEETSLIIKAVYLDRKAELAAQTKSLAGGELDRATASKLLHSCCNFDSAECAAAILGGDIGEVPLVNENYDSGRSPLHTAALPHAARCVEVLLQNHARTDLRTKDGQAQLALQLSLADTSRVDQNWNPNDFSVEDLVIQISEKDLSTVKLLSEKTKDVADVAYTYAVNGRITSLTALPLTAGDRVYDCVLELRDYESGCKEKATIYECLIREALALGGRAAPQLGAVKRATTESEEEDSERRKVLLREIELLQLFGAVARSSGGDKETTTSPLIRAAQGGDETAIQLLLRTKINGNDAEGNMALHWILKLSRLLRPQQIRIRLLLLDHGARVSQRNMLGLTAFHIAAGNGDSEALEVLLLEDPLGVHYKPEMKETPLFFAVKRESKECAKLLLTRGANSEVLNLRQRAIDLATSQDMRYTLLNPTQVSLINHAFPSQHKCSALDLTDEGSTTTTNRNVDSSTKAEVCKYFDSHQGCVRGAKCFYTHCEESRKVKEGVDLSNSFATKLLKHTVFPPSVGSDGLRKFCEEEFGSVEDAMVIETQIENKRQSRGFGFDKFRLEKSASKAMQAHNITMKGKKVEIKSLIPKLVLGAEFDKISPLRHKLNENIMEGVNPEQVSWADRLFHGQPMVCSTEPQFTKSSDDPNTPRWLKVFKMWFPGFLRGLSNCPSDELSSLKADFRAKFSLELDHSSVGYSKLSDFLKCFSTLCTVEMLPKSKRHTTTHMIIRPKFSRPNPRLLTLGTPHNLSLSALDVNGTDSKCLSDLSTCNGGDLKCLQGLSVNNAVDSCLQNLTIDTCSDTKCLQYLTADSTLSKFFEDPSKGTTCLGWVFEDYVLLGADSRTSLADAISSDISKKIRKLTPLVAAASSGNRSEVIATVAYMKKEMSADIRNGNDVNSVWNLANLCQSRVPDNEKSDFNFLIAGIPNQVPQCCLAYNKKGSHKVELVDRCKVIGSGGCTIKDILKHLCSKYEEKAPWIDTTRVVSHLLTVAALGDRHTGGILNVRLLSKENGMRVFNTTAIHCIREFYTTELSYLKEGVEMRMPTFQDSENTIIFLFYKLEESDEVQKWLRSDIKKQVKNGKYGHPLTELFDGYYSHRLEFKTSMARDKFYRRAIIPTGLPIPFTDNRLFFKYYEVNNSIIFIARQTTEMLASLRISARMLGKPI